MKIKNFFPFLETKTFLSFPFLIISLFFNNPLFVYSSISALSVSESVTEAKESRSDWFTHSVQLAPYYFLKWNSEDTDYILMEISVKTNGWVGLGFSGSGSMEGSDIVLGYVDEEGKAHLKDYHGIGNEAPIEDKLQDYELLSGSEKNGWTTFLFRRRWITCDENEGDDYILGNDTVRLIYAWHSEDPNGNEIAYHGANGRGIKSIYLKAPGKPFYFPDEKEYFSSWKAPRETIDSMLFTVDNIHVKKDTVYHCKIFEFPPFKTKRHLIGFRPIISPAENRLNVHHMVVLRCTSNFKNTFEKNENECYANNTPLDWSIYCFNIVFTWAIGNEGEMLPNYVGIPIESSASDDSNVFFKLEIHYDNPEMKDIVDHSGLKFFYTENLREYDSAIMFIGHRISMFHLIPPEQEEFVSYTYCPSECTKNGLPENGIKVIGAMLHAHLTAKRIRVRQFRDGKEFTVLFEDNNYDFNYQQFRILHEEAIIMPGDELTVECEYETLEQDKIIFGGVSTNHEMCQAYFLYYPKTSLLDCRSQPEFNSFFQGMGILNVTGKIFDEIEAPYDIEKIKESPLIPIDDSFLIEKLDESIKEDPYSAIVIIEPEHIGNLTVDKYFKKMNWRDNGKMIELQWKNGLHYTLCAGMGHANIFSGVKTLPKIGQDWSLDVQMTGSMEKVCSDYYNKERRPIVNQKLLNLMSNKNINDNDEEDDGNSINNNVNSCGSFTCTIFILYFFSYSVHLYNFLFQFQHN